MPVPEEEIHLEILQRDESEDEEWVIEKENTENNDTLDDKSKD